MATHDGDITHTSRDRLLYAAKSLFARLGYEQASTAAIVREAGSSESQLSRYFGGKAGLLEAVFNESWGGVNQLIAEQEASAPHAREAILRILSIVTEAFSRDPEMAFLFLFEGRRVRGHDVALSAGYLEFYQLIGGLVRRGQEDGSFRRDIEAGVLSSAMLGAGEGMIRERLLAQRGGASTTFDNASIRTVFAAMVNGLAQR